jgi:hypothetical protein
MSLARSLRAAFSAGMFALGAALVVGATASEAEAFTGRVVSNQTGKCLDLVRGKRDAAIVMWDCNGGANQQWRLDGGRLVSALTGQCVYVNYVITGSITSVTTRDFRLGLVTRDCQNAQSTARQTIWSRMPPSPLQWRINGNRLLSPGMGESGWDYASNQRTFTDGCLDVSGASTRNGANIIVFTCTPGAPNQQFRFGV